VTADGDVGRSAVTPAAEHPARTKAAKATKATKTPEIPVRIFLLEFIEILLAKLHKEGCCI
jgi:hypothetical protein